MTVLVSILEELRLFGRALLLIQGGEMREADGRVDRSDG